MQSWSLSADIWICKTYNWCWWFPLAVSTTTRNWIACKGFCLFLLRSLLCLKCLKKILVIFIRWVEPLHVYLQPIPRFEVIIPLVALVGLLKVPVPWLTHKRGGSLVMASKKVRSSKLGTSFCHQTLEIISATEQKQVAAYSYIFVNFCRILPCKTILIFNSCRSWDNHNYL